MRIRLRFSEHGKVRFCSHRDVARLWERAWRQAALPIAYSEGLSPHARTIAVALQRYGMILADNGSPWYVTGQSDSRFDDDVLHELDRFAGADVEVVDTSGFVNG